MIVSQLSGVHTGITAPADTAGINSVPASAATAASLRLRDDFMGHFQGRRR